MVRVNIKTPKVGSSRCDDSRYADAGKHRVKVLGFDLLCDGLNLLAVTLSAPMFGCFADYLFSRNSAKLLNPL